MKLSAFEANAAELNAARVRYLVVGDLGVNAHGYVRLTQDVDLVVRLDRANILPAFEAPARLGYRPLVPVTAEQFADAAQRATWIRDKAWKIPSRRRRIFFRSSSFWIGLMGMEATGSTRCAT